MFLCRLAGKRASGESDVCLEKQLERFEWQLRILKEANGNPERAELLKDHGDEELCGLVLSILDKVRCSSDNWPDDLESLIFVVDWK